MKRIPTYSLSLAELETLPTKRLLGRLKRLQQCESSRSTSDQDDRPLELTGIIEFKDTSAWKSAYSDLKRILASREHVVKGVALVERRRSKTHKIKTAERRSRIVGRR